MGEYEVEVVDACPLPPKSLSNVIKTTSPKLRTTGSTFKRIYVTVTLSLVLLIPTIVVFSGDAGIRSVMVGEVIDVQYYGGLFPHTRTSYMIKSLRDDRGISPNSGVNFFDLNGDLRGVFEVGSYYNVTYEKRVMSLYPDLREAFEQKPINKQVVVWGVGYGWGALSGRELSPCISLSFGAQYVELLGDYRSLFQSRGYYDITYIGDALLSYQKLANPYMFYVTRCDLTNYDSTVVLMRLSTGNDTIVEVSVDDVPCSGFTPVSVREGEFVDFRFNVIQTVEMGCVYTCEAQNGER